MAPVTLMYPTAFVSSGTFATHLARTPRAMCKNPASRPLHMSAQTKDPVATWCKTSLASVAALLLLNLSSPVLPAHAISGGGLDYASADLSKKDMSFANGNFSKKDFSASIANGIDFSNSVFNGARFFKAQLKNADFTNAALAGVSFEEAILDGAVFKNVVAPSSYFSDSILVVKDLSGADLSEALISPESIISKLCERKDLDVENPKTGVVTRESLMCP